MLLLVRALPVALSHHVHAVLSFLTAAATLHNAVDIEEPTVRTASRDDIAVLENGAVSRKRP